MSKKPIEITQEGLDQLIQELDNLKNVKRVENLEALKEARAQGDLSENADYDAARNEQAQIESRIKEIENIIKNAKVFKPTSDDAVNIGKEVEVYYEELKTIKTIYLVGREESDPLNNKISIESPLGKAIRERKQGDVANFKSESGKTFNVKIVKVVNEK